MTTEKDPFTNCFYLIQSPTHYNLFISILDSNEKFFLGLNRSTVSLKALEKRLKESLSDARNRTFTIGFIEPELGFVTILDEDSLLVRLQYIEQQGLKHEFVLKFNSIPPPVDITFNSPQLRINTSMIGSASQTESPEISSESFQAMLSYAWTDKDVVIKIQNELSLRGLKIWMDLTNMSENIYVGMARGVLESKVVVPCISLNYASRPNCIREINFAADNNKPMVPVRLQKIPQYTQDLRLEGIKLITSGALYVDLSEIDWENTTAVAESMDKLFNKIEELQTANYELERLSRSSQHDQLRNWLNPVDMDDEHQRLQKDYAEGTRLWLIEEVQTWIEADSSRVLWLNGGAGVGKSMMSYLISAKIPQEWFGAVFYCRHNDSKKNNAANVLKTIAFEISKRNDQYFDYLTNLQYDDEELQKNGKGSILTAPISSIYKSLLVDGLNALSSSTPLVILIDALDECGEPGEEERSELLAIVHDAPSLLPSFAKLIVTGRPEPDIWESLYDINAHVMETTSDLNMQDLFIFTKSRINSLGLFSDEQVERAAEELTAKSEGVFAYARLACDNIETEDPMSCSSLMAIIDKLHIGMDSIYDSIFRVCDSPTLRLVISTICVLEKPLTMKGISKLLGISEPRVGAVHIALRSILRTCDNGTLTVIHKSLKDFVTIPGRSSSINFASLNIEMVLVERCLHILETELRFNIADVPDEYLYTWHTEIPNFASIVASIPEHIQYAALYVTAHMESLFSNPLESDFLVRIHNMISNIIKTKITHWMELLSLIDRFADIVPISKTLKKFYDTYFPEKPKSSRLKFSFKRLFKRKSDAPKVDSSDLLVIISLLSDSQRVCGQFATPISTCAFQVYWTAIPLSPLNSTFYQMYFNTRPAGKYPKLLQSDGIPKQWSPCISTCIGHIDSIKSVAISNDGHLIASGSKDKTVRIWNASTGKEIRALVGHGDSVNAVVFSNDGTLVVSGSGDKSVKIWNAIIGINVKTLRGHEDAVNGIAISDDGKLVVSCSDDESVRIWNATTGQQIAILSGHDDGVNSVAISHDGKLIVSGSYDATVKIWDVGTGELIRTLFGHDGGVGTVSISFDGDIVVSGSDDETLRLWNTNTGELMRILTGHEKGVNSAALSNDGKFIVSGSYDTTIKIWNLETGEEIRTLTGHCGGVGTVKICYDGHSIVSGSEDSSVKIWNTSIRKELLPLTGHSDWVSSTAMSGDGDLVASGSYDTTVKIWDAMTGQEIRTLSGHTSGVGAVAFSKNANFIVSGSADATVRLWDVAAGEEIRTFSGHSELIFSVGISRDGNLIVSGSNDKTVKIWNATTGEEIRTVIVDDNLMFAVAISDDGSVISSRDTDGEVVFWSPDGQLLSESSLECNRNGCYSLLDSGWVCDIRSSGKLFWIPSEFRGLQFCSSQARLVIFTNFVFGNSTEMFIDVSDFK
ncbi:POC1 centriolar protein A [Nowakowskiella sp. JEL0407]|nr:POC1 centriolar protein A [Nowakowskiella sp. JEL0407]